MAVNDSADLANGLRPVVGVLESQEKQLGGQDIH